MVYEFGAFRLEPQRRVLSHIDGGRVDIPAKAFDVLLYLVQRAGTVVTRDELMKALWPRAIVEDNSLNKLIAAVRKALGEQEHIATLQGRGYQFVAEVRVRLAAEAPPPAGEAVSAVASVAAASIAAPTAPRRPGALFYGLLAAAAAAVVLVSAFVTLDRDGDAAGGRLGPVVRTARVTSLPGDEYSPALSPDGSRVAFSWNGPDGNRDIYITMVDGTGLQRLTRATEPDTDPAWSPDGRRIAFLRRVTAVQRDVFIVPALGGTEQRVHSLYLRTIPEVNFAAPKLAWLPDGERLLFASGREGREGTHIYTLAPATGELQQLTHGEPVYDNSPAISPDGELLVFRRDPANPSAIGTLMQRQLGPGFSPLGEPTAVPGVTRAALHSPAWSEDSRYLRFVAGPNIFEWERGAAAPRLVHNASGVLGGSNSTAAELSALALARGAGFGVASRIGAAGHIYAVPLDPQTRTVTGPATVRFFSSGGETQPRHSPDGRRVAFLRSGGRGFEVWVAAADGSDERQVTSVDADYAFYPNWAPDSERLVFYTARGSEYQLYVVDADGGPPQHLGPGGGPSWSADGEYVYVTTFGAPIARLRLSDGHREPLFNGHLAFESPDRRRLFYWQGQDTHVFMRSLEGNVANNPETRLVATMVGAVEPVDGGFFYVAVTPANVPRAFAFYDYETGTSRDVGEAPVGTTPLNGLSVSPDGTELLYAAQVSESGADLVLLEFVTARPQ